jgi:hypothetical protein
MEKHFVMFYGPGTFVAESTQREIDSWDVPTAVKMAKDIVFRYGSKPYGFRFATYYREDDELDSHISRKSNIHYLGGKVQTLSELKANNRPEDAILISNMEANKVNRVLTTTTPYTWSSFLEDGDVVLNLGEEYERTQEPVSQPSGREDGNS